MTSVSGVRWGGWRGGVVGATAFLLAYGIRAAAGEAMGDLPFVTFFLAVLVTATMAGWRAATAVAAASLLTAWHAFLPPYGSWALVWPSGPAALCFFVLVAGSQILLVELLFREMARLRREQQQVAALLAQQHALHRELQHRVANGIQSLASVLSVQANAATMDAGDALHDAARRLRSVAAVHRRLHDPDLGGARLAEALEALARDILDAAGREDVLISVEVVEAAVSGATAHALAMILAESVANSVKHAFAGRTSGRLDIVLDRPAPDRLRLVVADDGPGLRQGGGITLGTMIMGGLAAQIGGTFRLENGPDGGARVVVQAPL